MTNFGNGFDLRNFSMVKIRGSLKGLCPSSIRVLKRGFVPLTKPIPPHDRNIHIHIMERGTQGSTESPLAR
jgi:hypothetical protein